VIHVTKQRLRWSINIEVFDSHRRRKVPLNQISPLRVTGKRLKQRSQPGNNAESRPALSEGNRREHVKGGLAIDRAVLILTCDTPFLFEQEVTCVRHEPNLVL